METIPKDILIHSLESMPEQVDVEQVIEQIILLSKIERAKGQVDRGEFIGHDEVKDAYKKWLE